MQAAFAANRYSEDYETFFHSMNLLRREILTYTKDITCQALEHILSGDIERLFFGLGLLMSFGNIKELYELKPVVTSDLPFELNTSQIIQIEKAILYFTIDTQKVCQIAFQLLKLVSGKVEQYITFCLEEVFEDYSTVMYKTKDCKKKLAGLYLAAQMVAQYSAEAKIYKITVRVEYLIIRYWKYLLMHNKLGEKTYIEWLLKFLSMYRKWN